VSPDPIGLEGGLRSWGYGVNPIGWVDPLGLKKRTHHASAVVIRDGVVVFEKEYDSTNMTPEEAALGYPQSVKAAHTEARACREIKLLPGDTLIIHGERPPCRDCKGAMNKLYRDTNGQVNILYTHDAGEEVRNGELRKWDVGSWSPDGGRGWKPK
jgi:hypothetical protein